MYFRLGLPLSYVWHSITIFPILTYPIYNQIFFPMVRTVDVSATHWYVPRYTVLWAELHLKCKCTPFQWNVVVYFFFNHLHVITIPSDTNRSNVKHKMVRLTRARKWKHIYSMDPNDVCLLVFYQNAIKYIPKTERHFSNSCLRFIPKPATVIPSSRLRDVNATAV